MRSIKTNKNNKDMKETVSPGNETSQPEQIEARKNTGHKSCQFQLMFIK